MRCKIDTVSSMSNGKAKIVRHQGLRLGASAAAEGNKRSVLQPLDDALPARPVGRGPMDVAGHVGPLPLMKGDSLLLGHLLEERDQQRGCHST